MIANGIGGKVESPLPLIQRPPFVIERNPAHHHPPSLQPNRPSSHSRGVDHHHPLSLSPQSKNPLSSPPVSSSYLQHPPINSQPYSQRTSVVKMNGYDSESLKKFHRFEGGNLNPPDPFDAPLSLFDGSGGSSNDDSIDFSAFQPDVDLKFITRILLDEDTEDKMYMLQADPALVAAAEKPFYEILNGNDNNSSGFAVSPDGPLVYSESSYTTSQEDSGSGGDFSSSGADGNYVTDKKKQVIPEGLAASGSQSYAERIAVPHSLDGDQHVWQFNKGVEEASKFLPDSSKLIIDVTSSGASESLDFDPNSSSLAVSETRGVKNRHDDDWEGGRTTKQSATSSDEQVPKELYDELVACPADERCRFIQTGVRKDAKHESLKVTADGSEKSKGKKQTKREVVELRSLLILCAQSISADDRLSANQQLRQIRQHSSSKGDGSQRLAYYFADGLEARLAGMGSEIYRSPMTKRMTSVADILRAYRIYMGACPFKKISQVFVNQTIARATWHSNRIHIVDFGIGFGFHWPCLIQGLSSRPSGAPILRITGIDLPQPGFRPSERLEETGRRLADYAHEFNLPFEYDQIASKWQDVKVEDLNIREDEVLFVVCTQMSENLADETVSLESPRDVLLKNIRKMNPSVFLHGVVNAAYSSPFFITRFREALFHFSTLFDAFDASMLREDPDRQFLEREFFGQEALNVIACEGTERVPRPERYKLWQARNHRCGFVQLPLEPEILKICREKLMPLYHKDYIIDVDGKWVLQGWKGRVLYAVSAWKPTDFSV